MILNIIKQFNWVDIFVIILLFRICYIAIKSGFVVELFKFLGTVLAIYLSLHYYTALADLVTKYLSIKESMPLEFLDFIAFIILVIIGYFVFVILRQVFSQLIKTEAAPNLNRWGGLALGIVRGILFSGLIIFILVISSVSYFKNSAGNSYLGKRLLKVAPTTYTKLWNGLMSKFMTGEKFNQTILDVQEGIKQ